jgi:hypothetical protein
VAQAQRHCAQALIARLMSVAVVIVLEAIDIDQQHGDPLAFAYRLMPFTVNVLIEHAAILNAGEPVASHHFPQ